MNTEENIKVVKLVSMVKKLGVDIGSAKLETKLYSTAKS